MFSLCVNYRCLKRNPETADVCEVCGEPLLLNGRFRVLRPLKPLEESLIVQVFEAIEAGTNKRFVLRIVNSDDPELLEPLMLTAIALQRVHSPYPVPGLPRASPDCYFALNSVEGRPPSSCLVVEKIAGIPLDRWLQTHGKVSQKDALVWLIQLSETAAALHHHGFLHRDIKPENLILQEDGRLALIDFGTLCQMDPAYVAGLDSQRVRLLSRAAALMPGTPGYCAPEQNDGKAVPASDFFAIGRTLVHLITGAHPIDLSRNPYTGTLQWRHKAKQIDPVFADFLDRLMSPNAINRPHDIEKILEYLHELPYRLKQQAIRKSKPFQAAVSVLVLMVGWSIYRVVQPVYASHFANRYLVQGNQLQSIGDYATAQQMFRNALKYEPQNSSIHASLALSCAVQKDKDCAIREFKQAITLSPDNVIAHYNLANVYEQSEQYSLAEVHYRESARLGSQVRDRAINNLARIQILQNQHREATVLLQQELKHTNQPTVRSAFYKNLGWAAYEQKNNLQALKWLQMSVDLDPTRTDTYCLMAKTRERLKQDPSADWTTCLMLQSTDDQPEVQQWRAELLERVRLNLHRQ
ncbi:protein kinase domain-containing protein [Leptolyngbya sp. AN10]